MRRSLYGIIVMGACATLFAGAASARPGYRMAFMKSYEVKAGSNLDKAQCNLCHVQGQAKSVRNLYGEQMTKAMGDKKNVSVDEAAAALKKIEPEVSGDKKTKNIDLIKADKNPGDSKPAAQ